MTFWQRFRFSGRMDSGISPNGAGATTHQGHNRRMNLNSPTLGYAQNSLQNSVSNARTAVNVQEANATGSVFRLDIGNMTHARKKYDELNLIRILKFGAKEVVQEDPSLDPQNPCKNLGGGNVNPYTWCIEKQRQRDS